MLVLILVNISGKIAQSVQMVMEMFGPPNMNIQLMSPLKVI